MNRSAAWDRSIKVDPEEKQMKIIAVIPARAGSKGIPNKNIRIIGDHPLIYYSIRNALDSEMITDIVVSTDAVQHDFDLSPIGYDLGELDGIGTASLPADEQLRAAAVEAVRQVAPEVQVFEGRVCTGDQFIASAEQKDAILEVFGGLCCEMEGGAIAQICYQNDIPFVIIRAISDKADGSAEMAYEEFEQDAAAHCAEITRYMVSHLSF